MFRSGLILFIQLPYTNEFKRSQWLHFCSINLLSPLSIIVTTASQLPDIVNERNNYMRWYLPSLVFCNSLFLQNILQLQNKEIPVYTQKVADEPLQTESETSFVLGNRNSSNKDYREGKKTLSSCLIHDRLISH